MISVSDFSFSAPQCERCGAYLDSVGADCTECKGKQLKRFHFEHISRSSDRIETVWAIDQYHGWRQLMKRVDEALPWRCVETDSMTLHMKQAGFDVKEIWEEHNEG